MREQYLLDTCTVIELIRDGYGPVGRKLVESGGINHVAMSDITLYELLCGAHNSRFPEKNISYVKSILSWMKVVPTSDAYEEAALQRARLRKAGAIIDDFDLLIGCTAKVLNRTLVTDNIRHLGRIEGLKVENWMFH